MILATIENLTLFVTFPSVDGKQTLMMPYHFILSEKEKDITAEENAKYKDLVYAPGDPLLHLVSILSTLISCCFRWNGLLFNHRKDITGLHPRD